MNWGNRIIVIFALFLSMLFYFLYVASRQSNELVDNNYYQEEIEFQKKIDAASRLNAISSKPLTQVNETEIVIQLPSSTINEFNKGSLYFIHHSSKEADRMIELKPDTAGFFKLAKTNLPNHGSYKLRIQWSSGLTTYFREEEVSL